jgi:hypothetical protein
MTSLSERIGSQGSARRQQVQPLHNEPSWNVPFGSWLCKNARSIASVRAASVAWQNFPNSPICQSRLASCGLNRALQRGDREPLTVDDENEQVNDQYGR